MASRLSTLRAPSLPSSFPAQTAATEPQRLLLDCLHLDRERPEASTLAALGPADWWRLVGLSERTGVRYQLYERLLEPRLKGLAPAEVLTRLQAGVREQTIRVLSLRTALLDILDACTDADLPVLVLKGMHLAHSVYATPAARDMSDVDLLFRASDMDRATALFKSLRYPVPHDTPNLFHLAPSHKEYTLTHPKRGAVIDVHWMLTKPQWEASIDEDALWQRAVAFDICGRRALGLAREDLIAYLCFHACYAHHFAFVGLRPFVDIAYLVNQPAALDWAQFTRRVEHWHWTRSVRLTLSIAERHLGAPIPRHLVTIPDNASPSLDQLQQDALTFAFAAAGTNDDFQVNVLRILTADSHRMRLRLLLNRLFPPRGQLIQEFGLSEEQCPPTALLYLRRLARLLPRHGPKLWALARADAGEHAAIAGRRRLVAWLAQQDTQSNDHRP